MSLNRSDFYNDIREALFKGHLSLSQVDGMESVLDEWVKRGMTDYRQLAYMFATIYHETAKTMMPIEEYGKGKGYKYGVPDPITGQTYYGRGFVQLTWKKNYENMGKLVGADLVNHPQLALDLNIATMILFEGMTKGLFTGRKLSDYINDSGADYVNARRIINGTDKATLIAGYAQEFYKALNGN